MAVYEVTEWLGIGRTLAQGGHTAKVDYPDLVRGAHQCDVKSEIALFISLYFF